MFLECTPGCIVAAYQASYIRETQPLFEADGLSIGQAAEACGPDFVADPVRGVRPGLPGRLASEHAVAEARTRPGRAHSPAAARGTGPVSVDATVAKGLMPVTGAGGGWPRVGRRASGPRSPSRGTRGPGGRRLCTGAPRS